MKCEQCKCEFGNGHPVELKYQGVGFIFCSRLCLVEWIAPEILNVCSPRQWIKKPDEDLEQE